MKYFGVKFWGLKYFILFGWSYKPIETFVKPDFDILHFENHL